MARRRAPDPSDVLARLQGLPEAIRALTKDVTAANDALEEQVRRTQAILAGMPGAPMAAKNAPPTVTPPPARIEIVRAPMPALGDGEDEALKAAEAIAAARNGKTTTPPRRQLSPAEEEQRRFLEEKRPERAALVAAIRGPPAVNGSGAHSYAEEDS